MTKTRLRLALLVVALAIGALFPAAVSADGDWWGAPAFQYAETTWI